MFIDTTSFLYSQDFLMPISPSHHVAHPKLCEIIFWLFAVTQLNNNIYLSIQITSEIILSCLSGENSILKAGFKTTYNVYF